MATRGAAPFAARAMDLSIQSAESLLARVNSEPRAAAAAGSGSQAFIYPTGYSLESGGALHSSCGCNGHVQLMIFTDLSDIASDLASV